MDTLKSLKKLRKLQVDNGVWSLQSAALFKPVEDLRIHCQLDPDPTDMLNEEQLLCLKTLKLTKTFHSTSKIEKILKCLEAAPNLTKLELDMNKHPHNR